MNGRIYTCENTENDIDKVLNIDKYNFIVKRESKIYFSKINGIIISEDLDKLKDNDVLYLNMKVKNYMFEKSIPKVV